MVTASYVSDAMRALDADARNAGITILNEIGMFPVVVCRCFRDDDDDNNGAVSRRFKVSILASIMSRPSC